jgi:glutamate-1-semialdehyde 2,1-aminomutase
MSVFDPGHSAPLTHGGTFNNNELSVAAGVAVLRDVLTDELIDSVNDRGDHLRVELNVVFQRTGVEMIATGWGSLLNLHATKGPVDSPRDLASANAQLEELLFFDLLEKGYYLARRGFIALSIDITDEHVNVLVDEVGEWAQRIPRLAM